MTIDSTKSAIDSSEDIFFAMIGSIPWTGVRTRIRGFIEELLEAELDAVLGRDQYERPRMSEGSTVLSNPPASSSSLRMAAVLVCG
jgi:hypothetical protein